MNAKQQDQRYMYRSEPGAARAETEVKVSREVIAKGPTGKWREVLKRA